MENTTLIYPVAYLANDTNQNRNVYAKSEDTDIDKSIVIIADTGDKTFYKPNENNNDLGFVKSSWKVAREDNATYEIELTSKIDPVPGLAKHQTNPIISVDLDMSDEANDKIVTITFSGELGIPPDDGHAYLVNPNLFLEILRNSVPSKHKFGMRGQECNLDPYVLKRGDRYIIQLKSSSLTSKHVFEAKTKLKLNFSDPTP